MHGKPATAGKPTAVAVAPAVVAGVSGGCGGIAVEKVARGMVTRLLVVVVGDDEVAVDGDKRKRGGVVMMGSGGDVGGGGSWLEAAPAMVVHVNGGW
nr:hypothetical protein [Tanacetum cinerariifolium]